MSEKPPQIVEVEVLPPEDEPRASDHAVPRHSASGRAPFHPMAATLLLLVDNLWNLADWAVIDWIITIPLSFLTVFLPTFFIQRRQSGDSLGKAFLKAVFLGLVAAVPTSLTGTPIGLLLLAWVGINKLSPRGPDRSA